VLRQTSGGVSVHRRTLPGMPAEVIDLSGSDDDGQPEAADTAEWQPLSVREGRAEPDGPFPGVPTHLRVSLEEWVKSTLTPPYSQDERLAEAVALRLRISGDTRRSRMGWILSACRLDEDLFLDVVDVALRITHGGDSDTLDTTLALGGSIWRVNESYDGLVRRVSEPEQRAYEKVTQPVDDAAANLRNAWQNVYGRHPNPSAAWADAIKAVENMLGPVVTPKDRVGSLGKIIPALRDKPSKYTFRLASSGDASGTEILTKALQLLWPNPDRHGVGERRTPDLSEAENVVQLAVLVVGWMRAGALAVPDQGA
jgi:hypothetical protein